jgi:hypothetical protein
MAGRKVLLVGDNPFQGVSHVSQERARRRGQATTSATVAAQVVMSALENGAEGFMFTANDTALAIVRALDGAVRLKLYALVPDASGLVRSMARAGGVPGLGRRLAREMIFSANVSAVVNGIKGILANDPAALVRAVLCYEVSRIKRAMRPGAELVCVLLHELVTDTALALNIEWLFGTYMDCARRLGVRPGFETRNFAWLIRRFEEWKISLGGLTIAAPFNSIGFQMSPSKRDCEEALQRAARAEVIAFSILAGGYLGLAEAIDYVATLSGLAGIAVGVSTTQQASQTFKALSERFAG